LSRKKIRFFYFFKKIKKLANCNIINFAYTFFQRTTQANWPQPMQRRQRPKLSKKMTQAN